MVSSLVLVVLGRQGLVYFDFVELPSGVEVVLLDDGDPDAVRVAIERWAGSLEYLYLFGVQVDEGVLRAVGSCRSLRRLIFEEVDLSGFDKGLPVVDSGQLEVLRLEACMLKDEAIDSLVGARWPSLRSLDVAENDFSSYAAASILHRFRGLSELSLWGNEIGDALNRVDTEEVAWRRLDIHSCGLDEASVRSFVERGLGRVQSLALGNNSLGADVVELLLDPSIAPRLSELDLEWDYELKEHGGLAGRRGFVEPSWGLKKLRLSYCDLSDADVEWVLRAAPGLEEVNLRGNRLTDDVFGRIGRNDRLRSLDLVGNSVRFDSPGGLVEYAPCLESLDVSETMVTSSGLESVIEALPALVSLRADRCDDLGDAPLQALVRRKRALKTVSYSRSSGSAEALAAIASTYHETLVELRFGSLDDADEVAIELCRLGWPVLENLSLWSCGLTDRGLSEVDSERFPSLRELGVARNSFSEEAVLNVASIVFSLKLLFAGSSVAGWTQDRTVDRTYIVG